MPVKTTVRIIPVTLAGLKDLTQLLTRNNPDAWEKISKTLGYLLSYHTKDTIMKFEDSYLHTLIDNFQLDEE